MTSTELTPLVEKKTAVQLRFGKGLLARINRAADEVGVSRNTWINEAADKHLTNGKRRRYRATATELMAKRVAIMIRMDPLAVELVDEAATDAGVTRTIWIMDACLAALGKSW